MGISFKKVIPDQPQTKTKPVSKAKVTVAGAPAPKSKAETQPQRQQIGVRIDKRMIKVLKALADMQEKTLAVLVEDIVAHALAGTKIFDNETLEKAAQLRTMFGFEPTDA